MKYGFGVDLGGTTVKIAYFDENGTMLNKWEIPTVTAGGGTQILPDIAASIKGYMAEHDVDPSSIVGIGIGVPGPVDGKGVVNKCINLGWGVFNISDALSDLTGFPVKAGNDANVAALGEYWKGGGQGCDNMVFATLGTGVGGGIVIDGKVFSGHNHAGGELGHIVIEKGGVPCTCGRFGCWEAYSSATALIRMTKEKIAECEQSGRATRMNEFVARSGKVSGRTAFDAMRAGDEAAKEVVDQYISYLAVGIGNIINVFQPEVISIGGGISNEKENLLAPLLSLIPKESYAPDVIEPPRIAIAKLGNDAGIIGAAFLGVEL